MKTNIPPLQQDQAADYVLNQLSDTELAAVEASIAKDASMRLAVKELSDAAAAIALTTKQVQAPKLDPGSGESKQS